MYSNECDLDDPPPVVVDSTVKYRADVGSSGAPRHFRNAMLFSQRLTDLRDLINSILWDLSNASIDRCPMPRLWIVHKLSPHKETFVRTVKKIVDLEMLGLRHR